MSEEIKDEKIKKTLAIKELQIKHLHLLEEKIKIRKEELEKIKNSDKVKAIDVGLDVVIMELEAFNVKGNIESHDNYLESLGWQNGRIENVKQDLENEAASDYETLIKQAEQLNKNDKLIIPALRKELKSSLKTAKESRYSNKDRKRTAYQRLKSTYERTIQ